MLAERAVLPSISSQPQEVPIQHPAKPVVQKRKKRWKHRAWAIKASVIVLVYAALLVALQLKSSLLSYEVTTLKQEINALQTTNSRYEYQIQQLSSLDRIELIATQELQMVKPEWNRAYTVAKITLPPVVAEEALLEPKVAQEQQQKSMTKLLAFFGN